MALLFMDSFDHYTTGAQKTWVVAEGVQGITTGRTGPGAMYMQASYAGGYNSQVYRDFAASGEICVGFAFKCGLANTQWQIELRETATIHLQLMLNGSNQLVAKLGSGGAQLGSASTTVFAAGTWYYVEVRLKCHDSTGTLDVRINGASEITFSGDTRNAGTAGTINRLYFLGQRNIGNGTWNNQIDDLYICDVTGSAPTNALLGDCKVECLVPSGNGNSSGLTGSDGNSTDNYALVDETTPNDDTDYVQSDVAGTKDTYAYGNLSTVTGIVYGVQVLPYMKKADAGGRSMITVARLSTTEEDGATVPVATGYLFYPSLRPTKPGGGAWTVSDVNSAEFGIKVA